MENLLGQFFSVSESPQAVVDDVIALYELKKDRMFCVYEGDGLLSLVHTNMRNILSFDLHTSITHLPLSEDI